MVNKTLLRVEQCKSPIYLEKVQNQEGDSLPSFKARSRTPVSERARNSCCKAGTEYPVLLMTIIDSSKKTERLFSKRTEGARSTEVDQILPLITDLSQNSNNQKVTVEDRRCSGHHTNKKEHNFLPGARPVRRRFAWLGLAIL